MSSNNKVTPAFNMSSMTDLVFLLLVFFIIVSTKVNPNAQDIDLPDGSSKANIGKSISVSVTADNVLRLENEQVSFKELKVRLEKLKRSRPGQKVMISPDVKADAGVLMKIVAVCNMVDLDLVVQTSGKLEL